jgi:predicted dienelactone hydrolase
LDRHPAKSTGSGANLFALEIRRSCPAAGHHFLHGWGGSRTSYRYFAEHLASWGYLVILPTHVGSDSAAVVPRLPAASHMSMAGIRDMLLHGVNEPDNLRDRPRDISFVIDQIARGVPLGAAADVDHVGVAGHSFGAYTAMAVGGMLVDLPEGRRQSLRDARVKAVLAMSPEGTGWMGISPGAWSRFAVPAMFLTGTRDFGGSGRPATWRHEPFNAIGTVPEWQVTILYATHMTFVNPGIDERLINSLGTAFFDASLLHEQRASAWTSDYFSTRHGDCLVDHKGTTH